MYYWKTSSLSTDIKNNSLIEKDWKQYYLAVSIFVILSIYIISIDQREYIPGLLVEIFFVVVILFYGVNVTFNTNMNGDGKDYVARMTALSFPISVKLFLLAALVGVVLGVVGEMVTLSKNVIEWSFVGLSIIVQFLYFWRLNEHLKYINT